MTNIQIRDVPEPVVKLLKSAASDKGLSLQGFLINILHSESDRVLQEKMVNRWPLVKVAEPIDIAVMIREQRDERTQQLMEEIGPDH